MLSTRNVNVKYLKNSLLIWFETQSHSRVYYSANPISCTMYCYNQAWPEIHNKGAMMNVGYLEAKKTWDFDCLMFHDVDLLMEDDRNIYTCWDVPIHFGAYVDKLGYSLVPRCIN